MRKEFAQTIIDLGSKEKNWVFLTGDLGFQALEGVQLALENRFINAGVAEQNMISVAAAMASQGWTPIVYSIAPFALFRPFEQIRNDVCIHNQSVKIVGNGGGFGYGIMGATHHALEDIAVMRCLPNMKIFLPLLSADVSFSVKLMMETKGPSYLRLNQSVKGIEPIDSFAEPIRQVKRGKKVTLITLGPILQSALDAMGELNLQGNEFDIFSIGQMYESLELPSKFLESIQATNKLVVLEEHYASGGLGEFLLRKLFSHYSSKPIKTPIVELMYVTGYPSGRYGSQKWHLIENGIAGAPLAKKLLEVLER